MQVVINLSGSKLSASLEDELPEDALSTEGLVLTSQCGMRREGNSKYDKACLLPKPDHFLSCLACKSPLFFS